MHWWYARVGQTMQTSNLDPVLWVLFFTVFFFFWFVFKKKTIKTAPTDACFLHCSQDSIRALLWSCIFLHWFQYRSGWTSLCHATSADNKRERGTEGAKRGGGEIGGCLGNRSPFCNCAPLISWKCNSVHGCAL